MQWHHESPPANGGARAPAGRPGRCAAALGLQVRHEVRRCALCTATEDGRVCSHIMYHVGIGWTERVFACRACRACCVTISFLGSSELGRLASTARRFGPMTEEASRLATLGWPGPDRERAPKRAQVSSWLQVLRELEGLTARLTFSRVGPRVRLTAGGAVAARSGMTCHGGLRAAVCAGVPMRAGRHYAEFTVRGGFAGSFGLVGGGFDPSEGCELRSAALPQLRSIWWSGSDNAADMLHVLRRQTRRSGIARLTASCSQTRTTWSARIGIHLIVSSAVVSSTAGTEHRAQPTRRLHFPASHCRVHVCGSATRSGSCSTSTEAASR